MGENCSSKRSSRKELEVAETPQTVEVNVVMGAQTRAIVRSALTHVRNALKDREFITPLGAVAAIDEELAKWPLGGEAEDTLAQWLFQRFALYGRGLPQSDAQKTWEEFSDDERAFWEHEAAAVRRAVGRGGFKTDGSPRPEVVVADPQIQQRHQTLHDHLHKYWTSGIPMVAVSQVRDILTGRAMPEEYGSALQVRPFGHGEKPNNG
jgi:hypothetical protein